MATKKFALVRQTENLALVKTELKCLRSWQINYAEDRARCEAALAGDRAAEYQVAETTVGRKARKFGRMCMFGGRGLGGRVAPRTARMAAGYRTELATIRACDAVRMASCLLGVV